MANETLNPVIVAAQGYQMPTFSQNASVQYPTGLSMPSSSVNPSSVAHQSTSVNGGSGVAGVVTAGLGMINAALDRKQERELAEQQRNWSLEMMNKQNEWSLDMWNRTNEYNSPESQVARLRAANLNPLYYGLDGSSAKSFESAQPLGYDRASMAGLSNPIQIGLQDYMSMKSLQKDIQLKNAQIDKIEADTTSVGLDNEWKDMTMDARVEAENIKNNLSKEQVENFKKQRAVMQADIELKIKQADSEVERKALMEAEKILKENEAQEILTLLPFKQLLIQAQTEAQKASAAVSWANAAYQRKLIDDGYVDSIIEQAKEDARKAGYDADNAEVRKMLEQYRYSIANGTVFAINDLKDGKTTAVSRTFDFIAGKLFQALNITATALGTGIKGSDLGTVSSSSQSSSGSSASRSYSTMTGSKK